MMSSKQNEKLVLIYLSTFHLFDMNFDYRSVKKLDDKLKNYPYSSDETVYPEGEMYYNLQKAIITNITNKISTSERQLNNDRIKDRQVIDVYLSTLFKSIGVM